MPLLRPTPRAQVLLAILLLLTSTFLIASYPSTPAFPTFKPEPGFKYHSDVVEGQPKRIAIIGAGASGSSAAWFLSRAGRVMKERTGREVIGEITVFERDQRVGGREFNSRFVAGELVETDAKGLLLYTLMEMRDYEHKKWGLVSLLRRIDIWSKLPRYAFSRPGTMVIDVKHFGLEVVDPDFGDAGLGIWVCLSSDLGWTC